MAAIDIGCKEIAKTLNREGFRTTNGQRWGRTTVYKVLSNEAYKGILVWGGRQGHPAARSGDPRESNSIAPNNAVTGTREASACSSPRVDQIRLAVAHPTAPER